jgi:uroporphyrin-III C-methyltransferase
MGRNDCAKIAQQLIAQSVNHTGNTPVHILEAVSTARERLWSSTLQELAAGKADQWFDGSSPALIMVGDALRTLDKSSERNTTTALDSLRCEINDGLQNSQILSNRARRA